MLSKASAKVKQQHVVARVYIYIYTYCFLLLSTDDASQAMVAIPARKLDHGSVILNVVPLLEDH